MGRQRRESGDSLRWFEILTCCCKWGVECKTCVAVTFLYGIPITVIVSLTAASIFLGMYYRTECSYNNKIPYWLIVSSITPYPLLMLVKAVKEKYVGMTCWRYMSILYYAIFVAWMVIGSIWIYDVWSNASSTNCSNVLKYFSFCATFVHWLCLAVATALLVFMFTKICCCCEEKAIEPLKLDMGYISP